MGWCCKLCGKWVAPAQANLYGARTLLFVHLGKDHPPDDLLVGGQAPYPRPLKRS